MYQCFESGQGLITPYSPFYEKRAAYRAALFLLFLFKAYTFCIAFFASVGGFGAHNNAVKGAAAGFVIVFAIMNITTDFLI